MKLKLKALVILATVAGFSLALPGIVHAQELLEKISVSATMYEASATTNGVDTGVDNGTSTTTKAPTRTFLTTATLLKQLALDENSENQWTNTKFPANATLDYNGSGFAVYEGTNELVDVSDILSYTTTGKNDISSGTYTDANGAGMPPFSQSDYYLVTVVYDDSSSTGALVFSVTGLATVTAKATNPNAKTGKYTQSGSISLQDGTGEGTIILTSGPQAGTAAPFVLTGFTATASGSATGNTGNGTSEQRAARKRL
ncbi:MAG: hypothetical protein ABSA47_19130 [Verrucomicrobiota bacterium]|jgi:hypothetical protein